MGNGRVVYFPGDLDRTFWQVLAVDHGMLLRNAVEWATNEAPPVKVEGPGILDVAVWEQKDSMTLHLVNLTNPMMWKGPVREIVPIAGQKIALRIPSDRRVRRVHLLVAARDVPLSRGRRLRFIWKRHRLECMKWSLWIFRPSLRSAVPADHKHESVKVTILPGRSARGFSSAILNGLPGQEPGRMRPALSGQGGGSHAGA